MNRETKRGQRIALLSFAVIFAALTARLTVSLLNIGLGSSCSIVTWSDDKYAYFANNEHNRDSKSGRIWFTPAKGENHGYVLSGYRVPHYADVFFGGMNDQRLVFDMNSIPSV